MLEVPRDPVTGSATSDSPRACKTVQKKGCSLSSRIKFLGQRSLISGFTRTCSTTSRAGRCLEAPHIMDLQQGKEEPTWRSYFTES